MSRQQDPRTAKLLRSRFINTPRRRPTRDLQIERLESRVVLSGLPNVEVATPDSPADQVAATSVIVDLANSAYLTDTETTDAAFAQSEATSTVSTTDASAATDSTLTVVNLVPDTLAGSSTVPTVPTGGGRPPGGSGQPLLPPVIIEFDADCEGNVWRFTGRVLDDKDVTGLTIHFGGILAGQTATVDDEGSFELIIMLEPGASGFATAYTIDLDNLRSETVSVRVG